jgi:hypothetical protein
VFDRRVGQPIPQPPIGPFQEHEPRWLVDPGRHSEIAKIARELAACKARRLVSQPSSVARWAEAALGIERLLRLLRSSVHRPIRSPGDERRLWELGGSEIRERLDALSQEDREYVVRNGDRFWPDLPDPQEAEFIAHPQRLDELAQAYLQEETAESQTLEWNLVRAGLMAGEKSIRAERARAGLDSHSVRAWLWLGGQSVAIGGVLGWLMASATVFALGAAAIAGLGSIRMHRKRRALRGIDERLDKVDRALARLHGLSDDRASDGFEYQEALTAIAQPASFLQPMITRWRARTSDSVRRPLSARPGQPQRSRANRPGHPRG